MPSAREDAVREPSLPRILGEEHSLTFPLQLGLNLFNINIHTIKKPYIDLTSRSGASNTKANQESSSVQHGFMFDKLGRTDNDEPYYVKQVVAN